MRLGNILMSPANPYSECRPKIRGSCFEFSLRERSSEDSGRCCYLVSSKRPVSNSYISRWSLAAWEPPAQSRKKHAFENHEGDLGSKLGRIERKWSTPEIRCLEPEVALRLGYCLAQALYAAKI